MEKGWLSVSQPPSDDICVLALEKYEIGKLLESITRMPLALKYEQNGDDAMSTLLKYAANPAWGISLSPENPELKSRQFELEQQEDLYESSLARPEADFSGGHGNSKEHFLNQTREKINLLRAVIEKMKANG